MILEARKKENTIERNAASLGWFGVHTVLFHHILKKVALQTTEPWMTHMFTYQSTNCGLTN